MSIGCKYYDFNSIENHWHEVWEHNKIFQVKENSKQKKYYVLDMFPYPSGDGLHVGHPEGYTASDILARYKRACGYNVLHPMGWDAFGLPAERHAIKTGVSPDVNTTHNIDVFRQQIKNLGFAIDWDREINTTDPNYYKWTQWIFLQLFKKGLAYTDEKPVWWCNGLKAVLANEEVINGRSEIGNYPVERRQLRQWILKITAYVDKLLDGLQHVDWPESTKRQQIAWIGKSTGANIKFKISHRENESVNVYTTRPDTIFGVTFIVLAPEHELVAKITSGDRIEAVKEYKEQAKNKSDLERTDLAKTKTGVFTGAYAINPLNGNLIPIWIADYVLCSYGTGAIMAVPAHDDRDYEFAQKYSIDIRQVIKPNNNENNFFPFCGDGILINSGEFDGLDSDQAKKEIAKKLERIKSGTCAISYKLRDWLFSRQRYWGEPIPMIWIEESDYDYITKFDKFYFKEFLPKNKIFYREKGSTLCALPLTSNELPLMLPKIESYIPSDNGESPLAKAEDWLNIYFNPENGEIISVKDFKIKNDGLWIRGRRETNTMPQWAGSCWYYLRYMSPKHSSALVEEESEKYWQCPDMYIGGAEHAVLHLLYARFWHKFLHDIGVVSTEEPFKKLFHQGIILGEDGTKMSKSRGNVVNPDEIISEYGADAFRLYEMFLGPLGAMKPWNTKGIEGVVRFLKKIWKFYICEDGTMRNFSNSAQHDESVIINETIGKVTKDIENIRFNTAISQMMICMNTFYNFETISKKSAIQFLQVLSPFAPHIAEEIYGRFDGENQSISYLSWPTYTEKIDQKDEIKIVVQFNGKTRGEINASKKSSSDQLVELLKIDQKFSKYITDKTIINVVHVPGKIINVVVK